MAIRFDCKSCGKTLQVGDENAGKKARCPDCQAVVDIPAADLPGPEAQGFRDQSPFKDTGGVAPPAGDINPFASPSATQMSDPTGAELHHNVIEFGDVLSQAWRRYKQQVGMGALFALILIGVSIGMSILSQVLLVPFSIAGSAALLVVGTIIVQILQYLGQAWLQAIGVRFGLNVSRNVETFDRMFAAKPIIPTFLAYLLFMLIFALIAGVAAIPAIIGFQTSPNNPEPFVLTSVGLGALIGLPFLIYCVRYILYAYFIVDRGEATMGSIRLSATFTRGNKLTIFCLFLVVGLLGTLFSVITLCIGFFFYVPFIQTVGAVAYLKATGQYQDIAA